MEIVIDSHALFWFLTKNPKLSSKAERAVRQAEKIIVPSIVLMEILYILEKNNLSFRFVELLAGLRFKRYFIYPLDLNIVSQTLSVSPDLEMHDRIIVATAEINKAVLISRDTEIKRYYPETIW